MPLTVSSARPTRIRTDEPSVASVTDTSAGAPDGEVAVTSDRGYSR